MQIRHPYARQLAAAAVGLCLVGGWLSGCDNEEEPSDASLFGARGKTDSGAGLATLQEACLALCDLRVDCGEEAGQGCAESCAFLAREMATEPECADAFIAAGACALPLGCQALTQSEPPPECYDEAVAMEEACSSFLDEGYGDYDTECCQPDDPCNWASDDTCDCAGQYAWDAEDCY